MLIRHNRFLDRYFDNLFKFLSPWHGNRLLERGEVYKEWVTLGLTSPKSTGHINWKLKRLAEDGYIAKEGNKYRLLFDVPLFKQSLLIQKLEEENENTRLHSEYHGNMPSPYWFDNQHAVLDIIPWYKVDKHDEMFVQSSLANLAIRIFDAIRYFNFVKRLRLVGIDVSMPEQLLNFSIVATLFSNDSLLYSNYPPDVFTKCWPKGNPIFEEKLQLALVSTTDKPSIDVIKPYLQKLLSIGQSELKKVEEQINEKYGKGHHSPKGITKELWKLGMEAEPDDEKNKDLRYFRYSLALEILKVLASQGRMSEDLAIVCTTHPSEPMLSSAPLENLVRLIKDSRNLSILLKQKFPDERLIEQLPTLMSFYHLNAEELLRLKIYLKNEVNLSDPDIKRIIRNYNKNEKFRKLVA